MGWRADGDSGTDQAVLPGSAPPSGSASGFAADEPWDSAPPSAELAGALEAASGAGGSPDELLGQVRQWQALEAWSAAGKLRALRGVIGAAGPVQLGGGYERGAPEGWSRSLTHEVALALSMPVVSADRLMWFAHDLHTRFPRIGELLADGTLTFAKARAVCEPLQLLSDAGAAQAEAMIATELAGKTYGQAQKLAVQAALTIDPDAATRRRRDAELNQSRVQLFREESGAAALSGRDLPTDETLAAHASVCARATAYQQSGLFPAETRMDQFRVMAYLDLLNAIRADDRLARAAAAVGGPDDPAPGDGGSDDPAPGDGGSGSAGPSPAAPGPDDTAPGDPGCAGSGPGGSGPGGSGRHGGSPGGLAGGSGEAAPLLHRRAELIIPLATLLGLAERPGEAHGLGPLDPTLCRELAALAANSPATLLCVTITGPGGIATGHGCLRPHGATTARAALTLPARVNLTITAERLTQLAERAGRTGPPGPTGWSLTRLGDPGPPAGYGRWALTLPTGATRILDLEPVPVLDCDHRHQSHAYQPSDTLRHLVQVRDHTCTFPVCSRHARESDFEHAVPYHRGGRTCPCNAGARSRQCHQVKQSPGWDVTQPAPGWHQWTTPTGRTYWQRPYQYPD